MKYILKMIVVIIFTAIAFGAAALIFLWSFSSKAANIPIEELLFNEFKWNRNKYPYETIFHWWLEIRR